MASAVKYSGLCETCDHYQACMLKRMPQLEIIECEHFCTHPIVNNVSSGPAEVSPVNPKEATEVEK